MKPKRTRRKWTTDPKREIAQTVQRRLSAGDGFSKISRELDILQGSLRLWMGQSSPAEILLVTIERGVEPKVHDAAPRAASTGTISLCTPTGYRFDGLDIGDVAVLLEELR